MRALPLLIALAAALTACDTSPDAPPDDFDFDAYFKSPTYYTVVRGDSLGVIARSHGVGVDDLRRWNGLDGDAIDIDQKLLIWEGGEPAPLPKRGRTRVAAAKTVSPAVASVLPEDWEPPAMASTAGVLGVLGLGAQGIGDADLEATLASTSTVRSASSGPSTSLSGRSRIGQGEADEMSVSISTRYDPSLSGGTSFGSAAVSPPRLPMPGRKRCLAGPTGAGLGDHGAVMSQGLSGGQISQSLRGFVGHTARCVPRGSTGAFSVMTEITVGCDGRVMRADLVQSGGAPTRVVSCIEQTLKYASFPAHAQPDGFTFQYPIHFGR